MRNKYGIYELKIHGSTLTNALDQAFILNSLSNEEDEKLFDKLPQISKLIYLDYDMTYGEDVGKVIYKGFACIGQIGEGKPCIHFTLSHSDTDSVYVFEIYKSAEHEYNIYPMKLH